MDIPAMRQELKEEFEREAEWRRQKAAEYPDDKRNLNSAAGYDRLAATVGDVSEELMVAYVECFNDMTETELHRELLKEVFHAGAPESATEFVRRFVSRINLGVEPKR